MARAIAEGYSLEPGVLTGEECDALLRALSDSTAGRAGTRHLMQNAAVADLAADPRLLRIARRFTGAKCTPFRATLFEKTAQANWLIAWHQDTALPLAERYEMAGWGPWSEKAGVLYAQAPASALARVIALRVHLDSSDADNGPLRVISGSHEAGLLSAEGIRAQVGKLGQVECCLPKGGILAMRPLLIHASSKARTSAPRRVLHIEYADSLQLAPGIRLAIA